ncbi:MAG: TlpA family protein disulfide reductase, partial [Gemmatimonadaceae bacterium]
NDTDGAADDRAVHDRARSPLPGWAWALLAVAAVAGGAWLGTALDGGRNPAAAERRPWQVTDVGARSDLSSYTVRTASGELVRLAADGTPTVVMVSSQSCAVCKESLRDFADQADASGLPRLRMVTLEGAAAGDAMLSTAGLTGLWHAGPADHAGGTLLTFQFPGTPTFLLLDGTGRVRAAMPGYPGRESFAPWFAVITGERDEL